MKDLAILVAREDSGELTELEVNVDCDLRRKYRGIRALQDFSRRPLTSALCFEKLEERRRLRPRDRRCSRRPTSRKLCQ